MKHKLTHKNGTAIIVAMTFIAIIALLATATISYLAVGLKTTKLSIRKQKTLNIAEAGIEKAIAELRKNPDFQGEQNIPFDLGTFTTSIKTPSPDKKIITSIAQYKISEKTVYRKKIIATLHLFPEKIAIKSWHQSTPSPEYPPPQQNTQ